jgi:hypothetical protein
LVEKRKTLTTKAQRHQGKIHREDGEAREGRPILWEASPDADTAEGREKEQFTTENTEDTKGKRCKGQAPRTRRKEGYGLWIIRPCFRPSVVRVVRGHKGKILATENTEGRRKKKPINHG